MRNNKFSIAAALYALTFAAAALPGFAQSSGNAFPTNSPVLQDRYPRYVIQREDVLTLNFPLTNEFNQSVTVQPDGYINLQNSASVHAQGLTVPDLVEAVRKAYAPVLHEPIVNIDVVDFQKPFFTVSGQVGKPGKYELRSDITVAEGLAVAGGMTPTAKQQVFLFHRTSQDWVEVRKVNMRDILTGKHTSEDGLLKPGDMIYVPEKFIANFRKYVPYSISMGAFLEGNPSTFF